MSTLCVYINVLKLTEISVRALVFNLVLIEFPDELVLGLCVYINVWKMFSLNGFAGIWMNE